VGKNGMHELAYGITSNNPHFGAIRSPRDREPLDFSMDHAGQLTRTVRDAALVMNAIAGHDRRDDTSSRQPVPDYVSEAASSLADRKFGIPENFFREQSAPVVAEAFDLALKAAEKNGAKLVPVKVPPAWNLTLDGAPISEKISCCCLIRVS
jgi:aspartyl-tRNA(Asn)/glutamyl-tRNA(Gln) amidotransferase subunit A